MPKPMAPTGPLLPAGIAQRAVLPYSTAVRAHLAPSANQTGIRTQPPPVFRPPAQPIMQRPPIIQQRPNPIMANQRHANGSAFRPQSKPAAPQYSGLAPRVILPQAAPIRQPGVRYAAPASPHLKFPGPAAIRPQPAPNPKDLRGNRSLPDFMGTRSFPQVSITVQRSKVAKMGGSGGSGGPGKGPGCSHCFDPTCINGSKCQWFKGLYLPHVDFKKAGKHRVVKKQSKRKVRESEHMLPMQVVKRLFPGSRPDDEPTHSISYDMHRKGVGGAGGGITSTGSSSTAKGWANHLVNLYNQGPEDAYRAVAVDTYNSAELNGEDMQQILANILQILQYHQQAGRLTQEQVGNIMNGLQDRYYRSQK